MEGGKNLLAKKKNHPQTTKKNAIQMKCLDEKL